MSTQRMGAVARSGLRNLPQGTVAPRKRRTTSPAATTSGKGAAATTSDRNHVCPPACSCRLRQPWLPYVIKRAPVTTHKASDGTTFAKGGNVILDPDTREPKPFVNVRAVRAFATALGAITPGRIRTTAPSALVSALPSDTIKRAMYGYSTSDPIVMPATTRTITYKPGLTIKRNRKGEPIMSEHDDLGRRMTASSDRSGNVVYSAVPDWGRKWHRKNTARPWRGAPGQSVSTRA